MSQDGKSPMNESHDEQSDPGPPMNGHGDPDLTQPRGELKKEQDKIPNSEEEDDGNSTDFHERFFPFFINEMQNAQRIKSQKFFRVRFHRFYSLAKTFTATSPALP